MLDLVRLKDDLQVVRALNPGVISSLGEQYTQAFNTLLRRELRLYTAILRKQIAAGNHISPPDVILAKGIKKVPYFDSNFLLLLSAMI